MLLSYLRQVILHTIASFTFGASANEDEGTWDLSSPTMPPGLGAQLGVVAGVIAVKIGHYTEAVQYVRQAARAATEHSTTDRQGSVRVFA